MYQTQTDNISNQFRFDTFKLCIWYRLNVSIKKKILLLQTKSIIAYRQNETHSNLSKTCSFG